MSNYISEMEPWEKVKITAVVKRKQRFTSYRYGKLFILECSDKTGDVMVKYWGKDDEQTERLYESLKEGDVVEITGEYRVEGDTKKPYISVNPPEDYIIKVEYYDASQFVPKSDRIDEVMREIIEIVESVKNPYLFSLLNKFFGDENFVENFKITPGSAYSVYSYMGGLAEHTLNVTKACRYMAKLYSLDADLLTTIGLLHDIGKVETYLVDTTIQTKDRGKLLGHTVIGYNIVEEKIREIPGFPSDLRDKLLHAIISHHSPIVDNVPQRIRTREAYVLFFVNMLDLSLKEFTQEGGDEEWIYSRRMGREIYLG